MALLESGFLFSTVAVPISGFFKKASSEEMIS